MKSTEENLEDFKELWKKDSSDAWINSRVKVIHFPPVCTIMVSIEWTSMGFSGSQNIGKFVGK